MKCIDCEKECNSNLCYDCEGARGDVMGTAAAGCLFFLLFAALFAFFIGVAVIS